MKFLAFRKAGRQLGLHLRSCLLPCCLRWCGRRSARSWQDPDAFPSWRGVASREDESIWAKREREKVAGAEKGDWREACSRREEWDGRGYGQLRACVPRGLALFFSTCLVGWLLQSSLELWACGLSALGCVCSWVFFFEQVCAAGWFIFSDTQYFSIDWFILLSI